MLIKKLDDNFCLGNNAHSNFLKYIYTTVLFTVVVGCVRNTIFIHNGATRTTQLTTWARTQERTTKYIWQPNKIHKYSHIYIYTLLENIPFPSKWNVLQVTSDVVDVLILLILTSLPYHIQALCFKFQVGKSTSIQTNLISYSPLKTALFWELHDFLNVVLKWHENLPWNLVRKKNTCNEETN